MNGARRAVLASAAAALLAGLLLGAPAASGAPGLQVGIEDERLVLDNPDLAPATVQRWAQDGVDVVRIHARWWQIAPGLHERRRPRGFRPRDPGDRRYSWANLDYAIDLVRAAGMEVQLTVTGPGPLWSSRRPRRGDRTWRPAPRAYAAFAGAVARRYAGRIARYLLWNEPNIAGWLSPQAECRDVASARGRRRGRSHLKRVCIPVSPHLYRELARAAVPALRDGDPGATVVIGELAPLGDELRRESSTVAPLLFLREMACVDDRYRPIRGGRCAGFKPVGGDAFGHHPHGKQTPPDVASREADWAKFGDLERLETVLDRLTRSGRIVAPDDRFDLHLTEFGYETSPPDHFSGIKVGRQSSWLQKAAYLSWMNPRVQSLTYYQWRDEPVRWRGTGSIAYSGWQSGLLYVNGRPKPAYHGFLSPFVVQRPSADLGGTRVWGQVRPGGTQEVTVERRIPDGWEAVEIVRTDAAGYFIRRLPLASGDRVRMAWPEPGPDADGDGAPDTVRIRRSGTVTVSDAQSAALAAPSSFPTGG